MSVLPGSSTLSTSMSKMTDLRVQLQFTRRLLLKNTLEKEVRIYIVLPIDSAVLVHPHKSLSDCGAHLGIHGEIGTVPVHAATQSTQLVVDGVTIEVLPLPHLEVS